MEKNTIHSLLAKNALVFFTLFFWAFPSSTFAVSTLNASPTVQDPSFTTAAQQLQSQAQSQPTTAATGNTTAAPAATQTSNNSGFVPLTNLPGLTDASNAGATGSLPIFLKNLYKLLIGAAAVGAIIQIMIAGFRSITNNESVIGNSENRKRIQNAVLGLVIVLSPYVIFSIINSDILNLDFTKDFSALQSTPPGSTPQNTDCTGQNLGNCVSKSK